eukprot:scaffold45445_cov64-Phaeocystis_antarctica.AAC.2
MVDAPDSFPRAWASGQSIVPLVSSAPQVLSWLDSRGAELVGVRRLSPHRDAATLHARSVRDLEDGTLLPDDRCRAHGAGEDGRVRGAPL